MRNDPDRLSFELEAVDGAARTGRLQTAHGPVETPAFIPLATRGSVRGMTMAEVAGLGYELILGNTFHLFLAPGEEDPILYIEIEVSPLGTLFDARIHNPTSQRVDMTGDPTFRDMFRGLLPLFANAVFLGGSF